MRTLALKLFSLVSLVFYVFSLFTGASILTKGQLDHSTTKEEANGNMSVSREFSKVDLIWKDWASTKLIAKLLLRLNWKTREVLKSAYSSEFHRPPDHDQLQRIPSPIISDKMLKENDGQSEQRQFQITPRSRSTSAHSDSNGSLNRTKYSVTASTQSLQNISSLL